MAPCQVPWDRVPVPAGTTRWAAKTGFIIAPWRPIEVEEGTVHISVEGLVAMAHALAGLVGLGVGGALLRGRRTTTNLGFAAALLGGAAWSLAAGVAAVVELPVRQVLYAVVVVPAVASAVAGFACGVYALARVDWAPGRRAAALLAIHPATMLVLGLTNPWHHLVVQADAPVGAGFAFQLSFGPAFVAHSVVAYGILAVVGVIALRARRTAPALRSRQLTWVLLVGTLPGIGTALQLTVLRGMVLDIGAVTFVVVGLVDAYLIFRVSALSTLPVARSTVLETIQDGILVLDDAGVVVDANAAAFALLAPGDDGRRSGPDPLVGRRALEVLGQDAARRDALPVSGERRRTTLPGGVVVDVRWAPIHAAFGAALGTVVVLRDVSADVRREDELARTNAELREHLATIERLRQEVAEQAVRDTVTGLHNRRHLDAALADRLASVRDDGVPMALAIIDADHFKEVNDVHGHAVGDRVLEALAGALTVGVGPDDVLVRYGGEEFVVVMAGLDQASATGRVQHLRSLCGAARASTREGSVGVTVSAGLAFAGPGRETPEALLDAADRALYEAKRSGRDRLCVAAPADTDGQALVRQRARTGPDTAA